MTANDTVPPPAPASDVDSQAFWDGLRDHQINLQRCGDCSKARFPAMPSCPYCGSRTWDTIASSGTGTVYSFVVVHRPFHPAFAGEVPYTIATVDLDDGPRVVGRLEGGDPAHDARVEATYVDQDGWTELRFRIPATTSTGASS